MNIYLEYIFLDGNNPQQIRSKTKIIKNNLISDDPFTSNKKTINQLFIELKENLNDIPIWNFDGSSTGQADTKNSELILKPVNIFRDPFRINNGFIILADVLNIDESSHTSNKRSNMVDTVNKHDKETLWGWEQEYFIFDINTKRPIGWPVNALPSPQGQYYCAVGSNNINGRNFVEEHARLCELTGINISGINAEVALGQWEYQIGPVSAIEGADQLWVSRYILHRLSEMYNYYIVLDPKPFIGSDWNGSGMHVNFSTKEMRENLKNKKELVIESCEKLKTKIPEHINVYGINNENRLTGDNETCSINEFRYGIGDRTASIRIPSSINDNISQGYLEDRRPGSNANPYEIVDIMIKTCCK